MSKFAKQLVAERRVRRWTQQELGRRAHMNPLVVSQYETGTRTPGMDNLIALADALNVTLDHLVGRTAPSGEANS